MSMDFHKRVIFALAILFWAGQSPGLEKAGSTAAKPKEDYYWRLGAGTYGNPAAGADEEALLMHARFDWQMIAFSSHVHMPTINRCLELNPDQRFLVRLWPRRGGDNFLKYVYRPETKKRINDAIASQIHRVLENVSRPDQVIAFTFLEELPDRWHPFWHGKKCEEEILTILQPYRKEIERETGRPLKLDAELKAHLWGKYVESLDRIHATIRAEGGEQRLVLYWLRYFPFVLERVRKIVHPGGADGIFIYVLKPSYWKERVRIAEENGWPFFAQLSHNTGMKQASWEFCARLPEVESPYNLGYLFYGSGNPLRPHRYDNPAVNRVNNVRHFSDPVHLRWFAGSKDLGWDILKRHLDFDPLIDFRPAGKRSGDPVELYAVVPNPVLEGHFPNKPEQKVADVSVSLSLPDWLAVEGDAPSERILGELGPSRHRAPPPGSLKVAHWRLRLTGEPKEGDTVAVRVEGTHPRLETIAGLREIDPTKSHPLSAFEPRRLMVSGQGWAEPGFALAGDVRPKVMMRTCGEPVKNPSLADGEFSVQVNLGSYKNNAGYYHLRPQEPRNENVHRIVYKDTIPPHSTLVINRHKQATLRPTRPFLEKRWATVENPGTGSSVGYFKGRHGIGRRIPPGEKVLVEISGKATGKVNSHLILYFRCAETGERATRGVLTNRLGPKWKEDITQVIDPPFERSVLLKVYKYRYPHGREGTVWYGSLKIDLASEPEEGKDVSEKIKGDLPLLRAGRYNIITYFDDDTKQPSRDKICVRLDPDHQDAD